MKIAIIGGTGKVAYALETQLSKTDHEVLYISRKKYSENDNHRIADATNKKALKDIIYEFKPNTVINTVAYNDVDGAEENHSESMMLNAHLPEFLASLCKVLDSHFITYSTDYIFDGKKGLYQEEDLPNPINYYGKTKLTGENMTRVTWEKSTVIRTNVVFGSNPYGHTDFTKWVKNKLENEETIRVINGQYGNPAYTGDIAHVTYRLMLNKSYGIFNTGSTDYLSRYEMALIIADVYGLDSKLITKIPPSKLKQKAKRPEKGGLDIMKTSTHLGFDFCSFRDGLEAIKMMEKYT